ncbi:MAG: HAD family hydrolase [Firmicutes bacterium]|nr:HAD family hydrolase [Bacillota bacterium]
MVKNMKEKILKKYESNINGLTGHEALLRIKKYGKNYFPKNKPTSVFKIIFSQLMNSIVIILLISVIFSLIIGEMANAIFIGIVIVINTTIGTIQEYNAEKSSEKLQKLIKFNTVVIRDGKKVTIDAEDVVIGDLVILSSGNKIPADIRILESNDLLVDESILTGESEGTAKTSEDIKENKNQLTSSNMVYAGTVILRGKMTGVVSATALNTELGKIAGKVINMKDTPSPLVLRINKLSKQISLIFAIMILILSVVLYLKGYLIKDIFFSVIALTVSAIPEGLSTAMTITLSISSKRMAEKNVIVKKLSAVESLGSCTVIASDKTGTLTVNEQTAKIIKFVDFDEIEVTGEGYSNNGYINYDRDDKKLRDRLNNLVKQGVINNEGSLIKIEDEWTHSGDSIDVAFLSLGEKENINLNNIKNFDMITQIPYESENKYSAVYYKENKDNFLTIKGSVEKVLEFCDKMQCKNGNKKIDKEKIIQQNDELANKGFRVIALAYGKKNKIVFNNNAIDNIDDLTFIGLVGFVDPVKKDAIIAINECKKAGIKVYMITGDHPKTAYYIGKELGLVDNFDEVVTGVQIDEAYNKGEEYFDKYLKKIKICSRVSPLQKLMIVESLKRQKEFVAVTGDGVNDAPALKAANIGVAMGSGTDLAKETGDMIIKDDNFSSIVEGVKEGRIAYNNTRNVIYLLLSTGFSEIILYVFSIILNLPFPLLAIQFLWLNLITNGIESNAMAFEKSHLNVLDEKVKATSENFFNKLFVKELLLSSFYIGVVALLMYIILYNVLNIDINEVRTYLLVFMVFAENLQVFNCRNEYVSAFEIPFKNNIILMVVMIVSYVTQVVILYVPFMNNLFQIERIPFIHVILIFILTLPLLAIMESFKISLSYKKN